jgi:DNA polymerase epsilon subunit 2
MKVTLPIIQRVYEAMQGNKQTDEEGEATKLDPDSHLFFIDAFEMPTWHWSVERSTFEKWFISLCIRPKVLKIRHRPAPGSASSGTADARIMAARDRLHIIRQTVIRNEHFSPTTLPSKDREHLLTVSQMTCNTKATSHDTISFEPPSNYWVEQGSDSSSLVC